MYFFLYNIYFKRKCEVLREKVETMAAIFILKELIFSFFSDIEKVIYI